MSDKQPSNTQISAYNDLWRRLLGGEREEVSQQMPPTDNTDFNINEGDTDQPAAQNQEMSDGD